MKKRKSNDETREEFLEESREHLDAIEPDLLILEQGDGDALPETVNRIFRAIHSIKGASPFFGCDALKDLSHVMESILMQMRDGQHTPDTQTVDALLHGVDKLRVILQDVDHGDEVVCDQELEKLNQFLATCTKKPTPPKSKGSKVATRRARLQAKLGLKARIAKDKGEEPKEPKPRRTPAQRIESIRVSVNLIDRLINLAGELVLGRNQFRRMLEEHTDQISGLSAALQTMDRITSNIQEDIMRMRMQPISNVFNKFPRLVRDLGKVLQKEVTLEVDGGDVELDRSIIEGLADPLTHLVRNAMDHGIDQKGAIAIRAAHEGGHVVVTVSDDGQGIDPEAVLHRALEKGLVTKAMAQTLTVKEKLDFIFAPGLSTAHKITELSGRGVGMDVVKTNVEQIGGHLEIESVLGEGTTIRLRLPLTLAIIPALIVAMGPLRFAIPQVNVRELVRIRKSELESRLEQIGGADVLRLRNRLLPVVRLSKVLACEDEGAGEDFHVVVMRCGADHYGLLVDDLHTVEEIVVKPLSKHTECARVFSGTTIMGDGSVSMILDATGIAEFCGLRFSGLEAEQRRLEEIEKKRLLKERSEQSRLIMVFTNALEEYFAIPVPAIARLERIVKPRLERVGRREYIRVREESIPLLRLEQFLPVSPMPENPEECFLVIPEYDGMAPAIAVSQIVDTLEAVVDLRVDGTEKQGILGSTVVNDRMTVFLDLPHLLERYRERHEQ